MKWLVRFYAWLFRVQPRSAWGRVKTLREENDELRLRIKTLERERDFFGQELQHWKTRYLALFAQVQKKSRRKW